MTVSKHVLRVLFHWVDSLWSRHRVVRSVLSLVYWLVQSLLWVSLSCLVCGRAGSVNLQRERRCPGVKNSQLGRVSQRRVFWGWRRRSYELELCPEVH